MKTKLTIEQSQRLIELGVSPDKASLVRLDFNGTYACVSGEESDRVRKCVNGEYYVEESRIFTLSDLLSMLPKEIIADTIMGKDWPCALAMRWDENRHLWVTTYETLPRPLDVGNASELIDALYELLIWCINEKYMKL